MRTCPKVRSIAAHCVRLCPRNGETTAGLTQLTINCNNNMYWYVYTTDTGITQKNKTREHKSTVSGFHIYVKFRKYTVALNNSPRLFLLDSQSKQQQYFVTEKVKV